MKNVYEVLRQKRMELARLEKEVEACVWWRPTLGREEAADPAQNSFGMGHGAAAHSDSGRRGWSLGIANPKRRAAGWEEQPSGGPRPTGFLGSGSRI